MNNPSTCPHFSHCSGCELSDPYNPFVWREALHFFQSVGVDPEFIYDGFSQTRMRAKLAVRPGPSIGLFKKGTHEVLSIPDCLVHHPSINRAVKILNEEMILQEIIPYSEGGTSGSLRYVQLFVERSTGQVQLTLVTRKPIDAFCESLRKYDFWHSIWQNIHTSASNAVFGSIWNHFSGETFLWQRLGANSYPFHPAAFSQVHLPLFEKMLEKIKTWVLPEDKVVELYAGVGVIGLSLGVESLTLVENNPYAHLSFKQLKSKARYQCIDAKETDLSGYDLTIVDPPRKGLDAEILPKITSSRLIYVSCQFSSFKRDAEKLFALGWKLKEAAGYLLFPGTNHVEIVAIFICS